MRRPSREINIFNLSMLDVICSALGAFLILFLISEEDSGKLKEELTFCQDQYKECVTEPCAERCPCDQHCPCSRCPCPATDCSQQCPCDTNCPCESNCPCERYCDCPNPSPPFVAVLIRWETPNVDIDLHITNPQGQTCNYSTKTACGGELIYDYKRKGFTEVFLARRVPLEDRWWKIAYKHYSGDSDAAVTGFVYYPDGMREIPVRTLTPSSAEDPVQILEFKVDANRRLHFQTPR